MNKRVKKIISFITVFCFVFLYVPDVLPYSQACKIKNIRYWANNEYTRVVVDITDPVDFTKGEIVERKKVFFDLFNSNLQGFNKRQINVESNLVKRIRIGQYKPTTVRLVLDLNDYSSYKFFTLTDPYRIIIDVYGSKNSSHKSSDKHDKNKNLDNLDKYNGPDKYKISKVPAKKQYASLSPPISGIKKGVKRILIDPGHGGKDPGAMGKSGLKEKDIVLDISLKLKEILENTYGYEIILTRNKDVYLSLDKRTALANKSKADLFVSVHVNAHESSKAGGIETYFLNWTDDKEAIKVAARENAITVKKMETAHTELGMILNSLARESKRDESLRLAHLIQKSLMKNIKGNSKYRFVKNLGVKQALFYVLVGASMPSVLVELSFISNPKEERLLGYSGYRKELAKALAKGIRKYADTVPDNYYNYAEVESQKAINK